MPTLRSLGVPLAVWSLAAASTLATADTESKPFYLTIDTPPAPELTTAEALRSFTVAPGFEVELVAAEPLVEDPVAVAWDEDGHLYVAEMRGFMPDAYGAGEKDPVGTVVRLRDSDGDGRFDAREVLADQLVLPRALAIVNDGLLIGEPPNLWLCPSNSGLARDIDCSARKRLGVYGDQPGSVEHAENGLLTGIDNWLYSAKSRRRLQLQDGVLVEEPTLFRGQWGIAQDSEGRLFYNTNSNLLLGDAYDAQQIVAAGNSRAPGLGERVSTNDQMYAARVNTGVNRAYVPGVLRADGRLNRPTGASGMAVFRSDQFGPELMGQVFVAEPAANAVAQLALRYEGLQIAAEHVLYPDAQWEQVEFLASTDERFRPVDIKVGPDGALYVIDMYRGIIQDHIFLSDELRAQAFDRALDKPVGMGRIWRVKAIAVAGPSSVPPGAAASNEALLAALGHSNGWQRDTAQRLLLASRDRGLDRRLKALARRAEPLQAIHALWTLEGRDALDRRTVRSAIGRGDPAVRLAALRAGSGQLRRQDLLALSRGLDDPALVQQLIFALAPHNGHAGVQDALVALLLAAPDDRYRPHAIKAASAGQELALLDRLLADSAWGEALEQRTNFAQGLVVQGFGARPAQAGALLDLAQQRSDDRWLQVAVLDGLFEVSRREGFERARLSEAHGFFASTDETLWPALTRARRAVTWPGDELAADLKPLTPRQAANRTLGAQFYRSRCASCHGDDGAGIASLAPPLAGSPWVTESSERLLRIVLHGLSGPIEVAGEPWDGVMPGHGTQSELTDAVASGLVTWLNRSWGHGGRAVAPEFVADIRAQTADRTAPWTAAELEEIEINTHYARYAGQYGSPELPLGFVYNGRDLEVRSGIFNGPLIEEKEDHFLFAPRRMRFEFVFDDGGRVMAVRVTTSDGVRSLPRVVS